MNKIQMKKASKDSGVPNQRHQSTMQAVQNEGVQSILVNDESKASLVNAVNSMNELSNYQTEESANSNQFKIRSDNSGKKQRCKDRFSPISKEPRGRLSPHDATWQKSNSGKAIKRSSQTMYNSSNSLSAANNNLLLK